MGALKKILRALSDDDGTPSLHSLLVLGAPAPGRRRAGASGAEGRRDAAEPKVQPARRP